MPKTRRGTSGILWQHYRDLAEITRLESSIARLAVLIDRQEALVSRARAVHAEGLAGYTAKLMNYQSQRTEWEATVTSLTAATAAVAAVLAGLDSLAAQAIRLQCEQDRSIIQIALALDISEDDAKNALRAARRAVDKALAPPDTLNLARVG